MRSILSAFHYLKRDWETVTKYQQTENEPNFENIDFPIKLQDIPNFESQNKINVTLFGYEVKTLNEKLFCNVHHNLSQLCEKNIDLLHFTITN